MNINKLAFVDCQALVLTMPLEDLDTFFEDIANNDDITNNEYCELYSLGLDRLRGETK